MKQLKQDIKEIVSCWQENLYFSDAPFSTMEMKDAKFPILRFDIAPFNSGRIQIGQNGQYKIANIRIGIWERFPTGCEVWEDASCLVLEDVDRFIEYIAMIKDVLVSPNYKYQEQGRGYKLVAGSNIELNIATHEKTEHRLFGVEASFLMQVGRLDFCCNTQFVKDDLLSAKGKRDD